MGFKTDYKDITLKELCNLNCFSRHTECILYDYNAPIFHTITLSEVGTTIDDIPETFADWYVEHLSVGCYKDGSGFNNTVYEFTIREP